MCSTIPQAASTFLPLHTSLGNEQVAVPLDNTREHNITEISGHASTTYHVMGEYEYLHCLIESDMLMLGCEHCDH